MSRLWIPGTLIVKRPRNRAGRPRHAALAYPAMTSNDEWAYRSVTAGVAALARREISSRELGHSRDLPVNLASDRRAEE
jgi:hypothetical protein